MEAMTLALEKNALFVSSDDTPLDYLTKITAVMCDNEFPVRQSKSFMERVEIAKIIEGLEKATADQVSNFRRGILSVYRVANIRDFLPSDKDALVELQNGVKLLLEAEKGRDKIVRLQYSWLVNNLQTGIDNYR